MSCFFDKLYSRRERDIRSQKEDFLTEIFVEFLNIASKHCRYVNFYREIIGLDLDISSEIVWTSQYTINCDGLSNFKRPDIVGYSDEIFIIIENKIDAAFSVYELDDIEYDQLELYKDYLSTRTEKYKYIKLLTHSSIPSNYWHDKTVYWRKIHYSLSVLCKCGKFDNILLSYFAKNLINLLEDFEMSGTSLTLSEIMAVSSWNKLTNALSTFGRYGQNAIKTFAPNGTVSKDLSVLHGAKQGGFKAPQYYGSVLANNEQAEEATVIMWCGVITGKDDIYEGISSKIEMVPEISVGIGFWIERDELEENFIDKLFFKLNELSPIWERTPLEHHFEDVFVTTIFTRVTLINLFEKMFTDKAIDEDVFWDNEVEDFFKKAFKQLAKLYEDLRLKL